MCEMVSALIDVREVQHIPIIFQSSPLRCQGRSHVYQRSHHRFMSSTTRAQGGLQNRLGPRHERVPLPLKKY